MKKYLILVLAMVLVLCVSVTFTACNDQEHQHVLGNLIAEVPATCTDGFEAHYRCTECGAFFDKDKKEVKESDLVIAGTAAHTPELIAGIPQTDCAEAGLTDGYKCAICGEILVAQQEIPAKEHSWGQWDVVYDATEITSGLKTRSCSACGKIQSQYTDLLQHEWSQWTDNGNGTHTRTCSQSGCQIGTQTETCLYGNGIVTTATCLDGGYTTYTCTVCNYTMQSEEVDALGHDYGDFTADYVGLEDFGSHTHTHSRVCRRCNDVDTENCLLTDTEVVAPTCELGGYTKHTCTVCGSVHEDTLTQATGHAWSNWTYDTTTPDTHARTCANNPAHVENQNCAYTDEVTQPTCELDGYTTHTCSVCKHDKQDSLTDKLGHAWGDWVYDGGKDPSSDTTHTHSRVCARCESRQTEDCKISSTENVPTCESSGNTVNVCSVCFMSFSDNETKPLGHAWGDWQDNGNGKHIRICANNNQHVEEADHNYALTTTPADCINARLDTYTCVDCHASYNQTVGAPLGHSWDAWVISETEHSRTCLLDGSHKEVSAHSWTTTNLCDTCEYDALTYTLKGGNYVVANDNKLPSTVKTVIIRATYTAAGDSTPRAVTEIASSAFYGNRNLTSVVLPETLTIINYDAFYNCKSLASITFSGDTSALVTVDSSAFFGCAALVSIQLPNSVTTIGANAFYNCSNLCDITIPDSVTSIGSGAFNNTSFYNTDSNWKDGVLYLYKHLIKANASIDNDYVVKAGTLSISWLAFSDCVNLTKITLPQTLTYVDRDAFLGCLALSEVEYLGAMKDWFAITFVNDASSPLYYAAKLHIDGANGDIQIPDHVKAIPAGTFRGTDIASVVIPDGVTSIGEEAFADCKNLTSIVIPDSVTYIGANAFTGSAYFQDENNWQNGVLYINKHLIATHSNIIEGEFTVRDGTITIGIEAFKDCANLTKVTIAESVVRIGAGAFAGCLKLANVVMNNSNSAWFAHRVNSISRLVKIADMTPKQLAEAFTCYDGEWKLWS